MNMKQQLLIFIFLVGSSYARSIGTQRLSAVIPRVISPEPPGDLSIPLDPVFPVVIHNSSALPSPGKVQNCRGSWYCTPNPRGIAQSAIDGWQSFVFYRPGTSMVASQDLVGRTTIFRCPNGYSGPGIIGQQIKRGLQEIFETCRSTLCGRCVRFSYLYGGGAELWLNLYKLCNSLTRRAQ